MLKYIQRIITSRRFSVPRTELLFAEQLVAQPFFATCDGVLDVGANRGMFCTAVALAKKKIQIHAFEPLPNLQAEIRARVANLPAITVHESALGAELGSAVLHYSNFHEASSLLQMQERHERLFPGSAPTAKVTVPVSTLDLFFEEYSDLQRVFLKLDVQGYELEVINGCKNNMGRLMGALVEISFENLYEGGASAENIVTNFVNHGFMLAGFVRPLFSRASVLPLSCDCLFLRPWK